jgi:hypothetical protein
MEFGILAIMAHCEVESEVRIPTNLADSVKTATARLDSESDDHDFLLSFDTLSLA